MTENTITNIESLFHLPYLDFVKLQSNPIPPQELENFYKQKETYFFTTSFYAKIKQDMPEFCFDLQAIPDQEWHTYHLQTLTISNTADKTILQTISIPELTFWGQTNTRTFQKDTMGFELADVNFDGYQDIALFDTTNGSEEQWLYFVWNPNTNLFEQTSEISSIPPGAFDQKNQLIYKIDHGSALDYYYSTYKYIDGKLTVIRQYNEEYLRKDMEQIKKYLALASIETDVTDIVGFHITLSERREETGEMEMIKEEYVFYPRSNLFSPDHILFQTNVSSEIGQIIHHDNE